MTERPLLQRLVPLCAAAALALPLAAGCGLRLRMVDSSVRKPSNVAVYFAVVDHNKQPVPNLTAEQFQIYEDDHLVSKFESKQTILNPEVAAVQYTLLLVDMSGSVAQSGMVPQLVEAASGFAEKVGTTQQVAVYAFDGAKELHPVVGFTSGGGAVRGGLSALNGYKPRDPSTNLNGAVIEGLKVLQQKMESSTQPLRFATLVVFTDGSDRAHRVPREQLKKTLDEYETTVNMFAIGVGAEIDESELREVGRTEYVLQKNPAEVKQAFDRIAARVDNFTRSFYLLSYCSPARAGKHKVRIAANAPGRGTGDMEYDFDATGFGPNCDPNTPPNFDVHNPRALRRKR